MIQPAPALDTPEVAPTEPALPEVAIFEPAPPELAAPQLAAPHLAAPHLASPHLAAPHLATTEPLPSASATASLLDPDGRLYVFGYGSLIWKPGFEHAAMHPALLRGFHRRFCIWSRSYRGTPENPGLVLGLDRGGACRGVAFQVPAPDAPAVLEYLNAREMGGGVYQRRMVPLRLLDTGAVKRAVAFVADRRATAYCRSLTPDLAAAAIGRSGGCMGPNRDYLLNTVAHLRALGVRDAGLDRIAALLPPAD